MDEIIERPPVPDRHRLDVDAYYKMAETGILPQKTRCELIDGEIFDLNAMGSPHAALTNRLARHFARALSDETALVNVQSPLRLDAFNEPEPDLMLLRPRADFYSQSHPSAGDVLLLIEVSDSSLAHDRGRKLALYAKFGVPEVWIIDIAGKKIEVFREPCEGGYKSCAPQSAGLLSAELLPSAKLDVAEFFA